MSREAKIILVISMLFTLAMGLSNIFVNILFWKKSNDFIIVAIYNLMHYIFVPISFLIAGLLSKKKNSLWPLRVGIIFFILFFGLILLIKDNVIKYIFPLGILFGIASGFYWFAYHILSFDFTSENNRDTFNGMNGFSAGVANAMAPIIGGYIIQRTGNTKGYTIIFACSLALFSIEILVSLFLKSEPNGAKLNISHIWGSRHSEWTKIKHATTIWGLRDVIIGFLITVLIYQSTGSELSVGKLSLLASIISSFASLTQQRFVKPKHRLHSMYTGASLMFIALLGIAWHIEYSTLLLYSIIEAASAPFFLIPMSSASYNVINEYHEENLRAEYIINKEIALNTGRMVSSLILILLLRFIKYSHILNIFLLILGSMQLFSMFYLRKMKIWKI